MDNLKNIAKKTIKTVIKSKMLIILLIILLVLSVLLPALVYFIKMDDGSYDEDDWTNAPFVASTYTDEAKVSSQGITTTSTAKELWDKMLKEGSNVNKYLNSPEELEKLMNAEIITQYPKIGKGELDGIIEFERHKSNGKSEKLVYKDFDKFNTYIESNNIEALKYFTLDEEGNVLIAKKDEKIIDLKFNDNEFNYTKQGLTEADKVSDTHYKRTEITISTQTINYKSMVQQYTMPFDYLWKLLVISEDKEFVLELADLVEESQIVISVYDNIVTNVEESEWNYQKQIRTDTYAKVTPGADYKITDYPSERYWLAEDSPEAKEGKYDANYKSDYLTDPTAYKATKKETEKRNQVNIEVTKANVWIVDYKKDFEYKEADNTDEETNTAKLDNSEYVENANSPKSSENDASLLNDTHATSLAGEAKKYIEDKLAQNSSETSNEADTDSSEVIVNVETVKTRSYTQKINRSKKTTNTETSQEYVAQTPTTREKVEKAKKGEVEEENFVTILCRHKKAKNIILNTSEWLFKLLETDESTSNMVDLTKYLLYKVSGTNYGISEFTFSVFNNNNFSPTTLSGVDISLTTSMFTKEVFIEALENYSKNGAGANKSKFDENFLSRASEIYDMGVKYTINPELIITIALKESGYNDKGTNNFWGLDTPNGSSLHSYPSFEKAVERLSEVYKSYMPGGDKASMIEKRAMERQAANANENGYGAPGTMKGMLSVYSDLCGSNTKHREGNAGEGGNYYLKVIYGDEFKAKCGDVHKIGVDDYTIQEKSDYTAWLYEKQLDYWNNIFGGFGSGNKTGNDEENGRVQKMIEYAIEIANDDSYGYIYGSAGPKNYDCSSFMQLLYKKYFNINLPRTSGEQANYGRSRNSEVKSFSMNNKNFSDLQAGDLLWREGHVGMYIGNGEIVHASSPQIGIVVDKLSKKQSTQYAFTKAFRIIK